METLDPTLGPSPNATTADTGDVASGSPRPMEVPKANSRSTRTPRHYARRVFLPNDLLEAARGGMTLRELAHIIGTRVGRSVSRETVRKRLVVAGIYEPRPHPVRGATTAHDDGLQFTDQECRRLIAFNRARKANLQDLLSRGGAGDRVALRELHDRYQLRLPLVEAQLDPPLPWMPEKSINGAGKAPSSSLESPMERVIQQAA